MSRNYMAFATKNGYINLYTGRRIYFDPNDQRLYRAFNQEVQGGIAELMRTFMLALDREYPTWTVGQIHDSIILNINRCIVTKDLIDDIKATSLRILQETLPESVYRLTTPVIPLKLDFEPLKAMTDGDY
jgi:DNA polymerase I-like protein with 3'-5' exonuclease and polymerase domains